MAPIFTGSKFGFGGGGGGGIILPNIGDPFEGGYYAGLISHTADGVATHALIVAPRDTGATGTGYTLTTNLQWKTTNTLTSGTTSQYDGAANTAAMVAAGISDHPAAQFCVNLSIGGFTDWYLPARYELDIAYQNLKPTTNNSLTSAGINPYSVPERTVNRTADEPGQTLVTAFQAAGGQDFVAIDTTRANHHHRASTENDANTTYTVGFTDGGFTFGYNFFQSSVHLTKTGTLRVRAFRKVTL